MPPRRASKEELSELEADAYELAEEAVEKESSGYREYVHIGAPIFERTYKPKQLREWPIHTDFRPDELTGVD